MSILGEVEGINLVGTEIKDIFREYLNENATENAIITIQNIIQSIENEDMNVEEIQNDIIQTIQDSQDKFQQHFQDLDAIILDNMQNFGMPEWSVPNWNNSYEFPEFPEMPDFPDFPEHQDCQGIPFNPKWSQCCDNGMIWSKMFDCPQNGSPDFGGNMTMPDIPEFPDFPDFQMPDFNNELETYSYNIQVTLPMDQDDITQIQLQLQNMQQEHSRKKRQAFPNFPNFPDFPDFTTPEIPNFSVPDVPEFTSPEMPNFSTPEFPNVPDFPEMPELNETMPHYHDFETIKFQIWSMFQNNTGNLTLIDISIKNITAEFDDQGDFTGNATVELQNIVQTIRDDLDQIKFDIQQMFSNQQSMFDEIFGDIQRLLKVSF